MANLHFEGDGVYRDLPLELQMEAVFAAAIQSGILLVHCFQQVPSSSASGICVVFHYGTEDISYSKQFFAKNLWEMLVISSSQVFICNNLFRMKIYYEKWKKSERSRC